MGQLKKYIGIICICIMIVTINVSIYGSTFNHFNIIDLQTQFIGMPIVGGFLETVFQNGSTWLSNSTDHDSLGDTIADIIMSDIFDIIKNIGNFLFFVVAAFLGVKYVWSGVSGKTQIKETLPTFIIGATLFYSAEAFFLVFSTDLTSIFSGDSFEEVTGSLWSIITFIVQILAIFGIIAIGLKYMLSPADKKANIKNDLISMLIGLILVFSITNIMDFIVNVGKSILS